MLGGLAVVHQDHSGVGQVRQVPADVVVLQIDVADHPTTAMEIHDDRTGFAVGDENTDPELPAVLALELQVVHRGHVGSASAHAREDRPGHPRHRRRALVYGRVAGLGQLRQECLGHRFQRHQITAGST